MKKWMNLLLLCTTGVLFADKYDDRNQNKMTYDRGSFFEEGDQKYYLGAGVAFADLFSLNSTKSSTISGVFFGKFLDNYVEKASGTPPVGYNVFAGYEYNHFFDFELKFTQIVAPFKTAFSTTDSDALLSISTAYVGENKLYLMNFGPYMLMKMPLYKMFTPFFRFGFVTDYVRVKLAAHGDARYPAYPSVNETGSVNDHYWVEKLHVGFGFDGQWGDWFKFNVEYETPTTNNIVGNPAAFINQLYIPGVLSANFAFVF